MDKDIRHISLECLIEIIENDKFSHIVIGDTLKKYQYLEKQDRAFFTRLTEGTVEYRITLDYIINSFSSVKTNKMKPVIRNILRMGVYQIKYMDNVPVSAACNESVKLAIKKGFSSLKGFVNGVLRNIARNIDTVAYPDKKKEPVKYLSVVYSIPEWIVIKFKKQYGFETTETILKSFYYDNETTIACNTTRITKNELVERLSKEGITVKNGTYVENALKISDYDYLSGVKSFNSGMYFVQDESSMLAVKIAGIKTNNIIIDTCAAPGGKTLYCACILNQTGKIYSRDVSEAKTEMIKENIARCGYKNVCVQVCDATQIDNEMIGKADVVIADVPCSGLGVIGRKSDIKYNMTPEKQSDLVNIQRSILNCVKDYVRPGGVLIYSTCTININENEENVKWFVNNSDFETESIDEYIPQVLRCDSTKDGYLQLLPGVNDTNGFFMARLKKLDNNL